MSIDPNFRHDSQRAVVALNPLLAVLAAEAVATDPDDLTGQTLAERYRLVRILAQGGMGYIYLAEHATLGKAVAVKVLSKRIANMPRATERFLREAKALSVVEHENVVSVLDYGETPNGSAFFALELLAGEPLSDLVAREAPLPWARVKGIILQICRAIHAAHGRGVLHRDIKPENCFRTKRGANRDFIKVLDFGIAKIVGDEREPGETLTKTGTIFGTPEYMSPEQARGKEVDERTDVYSIGILLYELVTGAVPFVGDTYLDILTQHAHDPPTPPSARIPGGIPAALEAAILKCLRKDRDERFASVRELAECLAAIPVTAAAAPARPGQIAGAARPDGARRERLLVVVLAVVAVVMLVQVVVLVLLARGIL